MIKITTRPIYDQNLRHCLEMVGDLIYTDEPLLSVFRDKRNDELYLFDWVDADNKTNRWLVYKVSPQTLSQFIRKEISFKGMINTVSHYLVADIMGSEKPPFEIRHLNDLPKDYSPDTDLTFDKEDTRNLPEIKAVLNNLIKKNKENNNLFVSSRNVIISEKTQLLKQHFSHVDVIIALGTEPNDVKDVFLSPTLSRRNESKPNRVLC